MSLTRTTRRSGMMLILLGLLGAAFFWLTDPHYGPALGRGAGWYDPRTWISTLRGSPGNLIDAYREASVATWVGLVGSAAVVGVGLWLLTRRTV